MLKLLEWFNQIDWSATGSMIGGIGTCIAIGFAVWIAHKQNVLSKAIAEKQIKQTELDQKIALYDKRYEVYSLFNQYLFFGKMLSITIKDIDNETNSKIIEQIYYTNTADRELLTNKLTDLIKTVNNPNEAALNWMRNNLGISSNNSKQVERNPMDIQRTYNKLKNLDYEFSERQIQKAKMSEFCFPKEISKYVIEYISLLFNWSAYEKRQLDIKALLNCYNKITEEKIISKMKEYLTLSYEKISE